MTPTKLYPIENLKTTVLLKPLIEQCSASNVHVGEYSYYSDFNDPTQFLTKNVLYNYGISGNSLHIGKFCTIAHGVQIIMADANHATQGITTFPFAIFAENWNKEFPLSEYPFKKFKDTVIGNDVWIGHEATIMPGVHIGSGAIIGAKSVVTKDVLPYSIVTGNPAKCVKLRYNEEEQKKLLELAWWDWKIEKIEKAMPILVKGSVAEILDFYEKYGKK